MMLRFICRFTARMRCHAFEAGEHLLHVYLKPGFPVAGVTDTLDQISPRVHSYYYSRNGGKSARKVGGVTLGKARE
jgi:hypothetical protein